MNYQDKIKELEAKIASLTAELESLKQINSQLVEQNQLLRRALFGKSSERKPDPEGKGDGSKPRLCDADKKQVAEAKKLQQEARAILRGVDQKLAKGRSKNRSNIEEDAVRLRVPNGLYCNNCNCMVKDQG